MDPNEHHGAPSEPDQSADRFPAQPHGDGPLDGGSPVAGLAGEFGAELVQAIRASQAQGSSFQPETALTHQGDPVLSRLYARAAWP
ncbi:hypothetical protein AB0E08_35410 [Streptomyces sp. NPDC048281]|uniref:hypothetical protein n=1 Tax=Streptomyces sp. NPDC048281 TaxID=3154715 RepID=UPI00341234F1